MQTGAAAGSAPPHPGRGPRPPPRTAPALLRAHHLSGRPARLPTTGRRRQFEVLGGMKALPEGGPHAGGVGALDLLQDPLMLRDSARTLTALRHLGWKLRSRRGAAPRRTRERAARGQRERGARGASASGRGEERGGEKGGGERSAQRRCQPAPGPGAGTCQRPRCYLVQRGLETRRLPLCPAGAPSCN